MKKVNFTNIKSEKEFNYYFINLISKHFIKCSVNKLVSNCYSIENTKGRGLLDIIVIAKYNYLFELKYNNYTPSAIQSFNINANKYNFLVKYCNKDINKILVNNSCTSEEFKQEKEFINFLKNLFT